MEEPLAREEEGCGMPKPAWIDIRKEGEVWLSLKMDGSQSKR